VQAVQNVNNQSVATTMTTADALSATAKSKEIVPVPGPVLIRGFALWPLTR
jgi:hypothetical protein